MSGEIETTQEPLREAWLAKLLIVSGEIETTYRVIVLERDPRLLIVSGEIETDFARHIKGR